MRRRSRPGRSRARRTLRCRCRRTRNRRASIGARFGCVARSRTTRTRSVPRRRCSRRARRDRAPLVSRRRNRESATARRGSTSTSESPARTSAASPAWQPLSTSARFALCATNSRKCVRAAQRLARSFRFDAKSAGGRPRNATHPARARARAGRASRARCRRAASRRRCRRAVRRWRRLRPAARTDTALRAATAHRAARSRRPAPTTHDAADPPMPEPNAMPLSSSISKPNGSASASRIAMSAAPAVLRFRFERQVDAWCRESRRCGRSARRCGAPSRDRRVLRWCGRECRIPRRYCRPTRARMRSPSSCARSEPGDDAQQIGEHAGGGHVRAGARTLHDQRIVAE